jgi:hypothetical protein
MHMRIVVNIIVYKIASKIIGIRWCDLLEFTSIIYWNCRMREVCVKLCINKCTVTSFAVLGMRPEGNEPKKWRTNSWFIPHEDASAHRSGLINAFIAKNSVTTLNIPHTLLNCLQFIFTCSLNLNQQWRDGAFIILLT